MNIPERKLIAAIEQYISEAELTPHELWEIELAKKDLERKLADKILTKDSNA